MNAAGRVRDTMAPLTVRAIFVTALHIYRRYPLRVAVLALLLFLPVELLDRTIAELFQEPSSSLGQALASVMPQLVVSGLSLLVELMYAGLLDFTAEATLSGRPAPTVRTTLRDLPYLRLIAASVLVGILAVVGFIALVVPGFVVLTLCCIVGPVTIREQRGPIGTIARSARLVRPRWRVAAAVFFLPTLASATLEDLSGDIVGHDVLATLLVSAVLHVTLAAVGGLMIAVLGDQLLRRAPQAIAEAY
jgi:hypothetical protein